MQSLFIFTSAMSLVSSEASLSTTLGALEIGVIVSVFLFGIVTVQTYLYYEQFARDRWHLKLLVGSIWVFDLSHTICILHLIYTATINSDGHFDEVVKFPSLYASSFFEFLVVYQTQTFFIFRLWKLLGPRFGIPCTILSILVFVGGILHSVVAFTSSSWQVYKNKWSWLLTVVLPLAVFVDVVITTSLCWFFNKQRRNTISQNTAWIVERLITWTIQNGLMTSIGATVTLITFLTMPNNFIWIGVYVTLSKLHSSSVLASLNSRAKIRQHNNHSNTFSGNKVSLFGRVPPSSIKFTHNEPRDVVHTTTLSLNSDGILPGTPMQKPETQ